MKKTEVQLFENTYRMRCETFGCGETSVYFVGRPDAPLSTALNLCETCGDQLVQSVKEMFNLHSKDSHAPNKVATIEGVEVTSNELTSNPLVEQTDLEGVKDHSEAHNPTVVDEPEDNDVKTDVAAVDSSEDDDLDAEPTLEEIVESIRTHAELDELAKELGVENVPSRDDAKLDERKQFVIAEVDKQNGE